jgi:hypothetical protein
MWASPYADASEGTLARTRVGAVTTAVIMAGRVDSAAAAASYGALGRECVGRCLDGVCVLPPRARFCCRAYHGYEGDAGDDARGYEGDAGDDARGYEGDAVDDARGYKGDAGDDARGYEGDAGYDQGDYEGDAGDDQGGYGEARAKRAAAGSRATAAAASAARSAAQVAAFGGDGGRRRPGWTCWRHPYEA